MVVLPSKSRVLVTEAASERDIIPSFGLAVPLFKNSVHLCRLAEFEGFGRLE